MRARSTVVYLIIALGLALVYLYDIHRERKTKEAQESAVRLFHISPEEVETITLTKADTTIRLQKREISEGSRWWVVAPIEHPADGAAAEALAGRLASLRSMRMLTETPENPNQFGLLEPELTIHFQAQGKSGTLTVGDLLPTEDGYYVQKAGDSRVQIISDLDKKELDKDLHSLRRKRLFTLSLDDVIRFVMTRGSETWQLVAENGQWRFEDDPGFRVNSQKVNSILIRFTRAEALSFVDEPLDTPQSHGLDAPGVTVTLSDGKTTESLLLGKPVSNGTGLYAKMNGRSQMVTISEHLVESLPASRMGLEETTKEKSGDT